MPVISSEAEIGYRACLSSGCHKGIPIGWGTYKLGRLIFHSSVG